MEDMPPEGSLSQCHTADVLLFFNTKVAEALATAVVTAEIFPTEILNEVRSSYTHLAKASVLGPSDVGYFDENANARRHLKRVCLDCYKLAIVAVSEKIDDFVDSIESYSALPNSVYVEKEALKNRRKALIADEVKFITHHTVDDLMELFLSYQVMLDTIRKEYSGHSAEIQGRKTRKAKWRNIIAGILLGVLSSVVASYLYDYVKAWPTPLSVIEREIHSEPADKDHPPVPAPSTPAAPLQQ